MVVNTSNYNTDPITIPKSKDLPKDTIQSSANNLHKHNNKSNRIDSLMVKTRAEYESSHLIIMSHTNNNLYFKWLSQEVAQWMMNVIFSKQYIAGIMIANVILVLISSLTYKQPNIILIYIIVTILYSAITIVFSVLYMLSMNLDVIYLVTHSFDFWFKTWNSFIFECSYIWLNLCNDDRLAIDLILNILSRIGLYCCYFLIDAIPTHYNIKRFLLSVGCLIWIPYMIFSYFTYDNLYINPFERYNFEQTRMNVKDLFLGSNANIILFIAKPILGDVARWFWVKFKKRTSQTSNSNTANTVNTRQKNKDIERLLTLYKRSNVKWCNSVTI